MNEQVGGPVAGAPTWLDGVVLQSRRDVCLVRAQVGSKLHLVVHNVNGPIHVRCQCARAVGAGEVPVDVHVEQYVFRGQVEEGCRLLKHDRAHAPGGQLAPLAPSKAPTSALLSDHDLFLFCCN
eukprot:808406-Prorocentrum_minimum.AAC.1